MNRFTDMLRELGWKLRWERAWQRGAAAVLVVAVGAGTSLALLPGGDDGGGAAEPRQVGEQLIDALTTGDLYGIIDLWHPQERDTYRSALTSIDQALDWRDVTRGGARLGNLDGVEIGAGDLDIRSEQVDPETWNLTFDGEIEMAADTDALLTEGGGAATRRIQIDDQLLTVVLHADQRWYLSLGATFAERLVARYGRGGEPVAAVGAISPEAAAQAFLTAVGDQDVRAALAVLDPVEAGALQRSAGSWAGGIEDELRDQGIWDLAGLELSVGERRGGRVPVTVTAGTLTLEPETRDVVTIDADDDCYRVRDRLAVEEFCASDLAADADAAGLNAGMFAAVADGDTRTLLIREHDGLWYVSLGSSLVGVAATVGSFAGPDEILRLLLG